jgi:hypothetical protein
LRSELITDLSRAADECLLLSDASPLRCRPTEPNIVAIICQLLAQCHQLAEPVMVDGSGGQFEQLLLWECQPVTHTEVIDRVDAQFPAQKLIDAPYQDVVMDER